MHMKKTILMLQARTTWYDLSKDEAMFVNLNLAFLRIATLCKHDEIDFDIIDCNNRGITDETIQQNIHTRQPELVIISLDIKGIESAYTITTLIKKISPDTKVMWTSIGIGFLGPFALLFKGFILQNPNIDYVLYGDESELTTFFTEFFEKKQITSGGIGYKLDNGRLVFNPIVRTNLYIEEDYSAVNMEEYIWRWGQEIISPIYVKKQRILPVATGVGCAYACTFCINSNKEWKQHFKLKSTDMLLKQLTFLITTFRPDVIWFQDDNFFKEKERAQAALELLNSHHIKWTGQGRADYFHEDYITEDFFRHYIAPGCLWFGVGFETFSDPLRKKLRKHVTSTQLESVALLCDTYGVPFNPAFLYGTIEQSEEEFKTDVLKLLEFHQKYPKTTFSFQLYRPYPGTREYQKLLDKKYNFTFPEQLEEWLHADIENLYTLEQYGWLSSRFKTLILYGRFLIALYCGYGRFGTTFTANTYVYRFLLANFRKENFVLYVFSAFYKFYSRHLKTFLSHIRL